MLLDPRSLYQEVTKKKKLPFFKWNDWLRKQVDMLQFEQMYKKKTEFEYAKRLAERYEVREGHFWLWICVGNIFYTHCYLKFSKILVIILYVNLWEL